MDQLYGGRCAPVISQVSTPPKKLGNHSAKKIAFTNSSMKDLDVAESHVIRAACSYAKSLIPKVRKGVDKDGLLKTQG